MALLTLPFSSETQKEQPTKRKKQQKPKPKPKSKQQNPSSSSWDQFKNLLTCKQMDVVGTNKAHEEVKNLNGYSKLKSCSSICSFRDVVHGNTRVVHRADNSPESSTVGVNSGVISRRKQLTDGGSSSTSKTHGSYTSSSRGMQFRKLSGCYECHTIVDPSRYTIPRSTICVCSKCGEVFPKIESLEHHQAVRHAVSELGPEDSGRNIVEIIFKSSWLKPNQPIFTIERILKVNNTRRTIQRFEDCRDAVKLRATAAATRCAADGNELLRFHCTTVACPLGARNSTTLCTVVNCGVCHVIRHGLQNPKSGGPSGGGGGGSSGGSSGGVKVGIRTTVSGGGGGGGGSIGVVGCGGGGGGGGVKCGIRTMVSSGGGCDGGVGVLTTASSGRAHDCLGGGTVGERRAMLVCRVIAGKVKRVGEDAPPDEVGLYDSVAGSGGLYSSVEELYVFNPRAILPCFVVIYKALQS